MNWLKRHTWAFVAFPLIGLASAFSEWANDLYDCNGSATCDSVGWVVIYGGCSIVIYVAAKKAHRYVTGEDPG